MQFLSQYNMTRKFYKNALQLRDTIWTDRVISSDLLRRERTAGLWMWNLWGHRKTFFGKKLNAEVSSIVHEDFSEGDPVEYSYCTFVYRDLGSFPGNMVYVKGMMKVSGQESHWSSVQLSKAFCSFDGQLYTVWPDPAKFNATRTRTEPLPAQEEVF